MKKKNIIFTWEFGSGLGHYVPIVSIIKKLDKDLFNFILVLKDIEGIKKFNLSKDIIIIQAPLNNSIYNLNLLTYSDILFSNGYYSFSNLNINVNNWCNIFDKYSPDIVICDYSPTAVLAAKIKNIKNISIGTGFFIPPVLEKPICFNKNNEKYLEFINKIDYDVLFAINKVFKNNNKKIIFKSVNQAVRSDFNYFRSYIELDHYKDFRQEEDKKYFIGDIFNNDFSHVPEWPIGPGKKIFVYLKKDYLYLKELIKELILIKLPVIIYVNELDKESDLLISNSLNIKHSKDVINICAIIKDIDLFICNGGSGAVSQVLENGKPVLLLPIFTEQNMFSENVVKIGCGLSVLDKDFLKSFSFKLNELLNKESFLLEAIKFKNKYKTNNSIQIIISKILSII